MGTERSHTSAATDVDHLSLRRFDMEISEGAYAGNDVTRLKAEHIARSDAGSAILAGGWRCNANVESQRELCHPVAGKRVVVTPARLGVACDKIKGVLILPHGGEGLGNVEIAEADLLVSGYVELQIVARSEGELLGTISRLENQFLNESRNAAVAHYAEPAGLRCTGSRADGTRDVDVKLAIALLNRVCCQTPADWRSRGRAVEQAEAAVMLGALDHAPHNQSIGEMGVAVGTESVRGIETVLRVAVDGVGLVSMVETNYIAAR